MQLPWLEQLVKEGKVSVTARDGIYADCEKIVKKASFQFTPEQAARNAADAAALAEKAKKFILPLYAAAVPFMPMMVNKVLGNRAEKKSVQEAFVDMDRVKAKLMAHKDFAGADKDKLEARFNEVAQLAPTVARNEAMMTRLLKEKLHSGLTGEDVNSLALIQASYTPNFSYQKKLTKTAAQAELGETAADMVLVCAQAGLLKTAGNLGIGKILRHSLMMTAGPALIGVGVGAVNQLSAIRDNQVRERRLSASFEEAVNGNHPDQALLQANKEKARQAFQTLVHFAPSVAMQPVAARSFMKKLVDYKGDVHSGDLKDLTEIEKNMRGAHNGSPFSKGLAAGAEAAGLRDTIKSTIGTVTDPFSSRLESEIASNLGLKPAKARYLENTAT